MKLSIASDHGGYILKNKILLHLKNKGIEIIDFGVNCADSAHYPNLGEKVSLNVSQKKTDLGILVCGTGIGMSIVANKFPGIRAALVHNKFTAEMTKAHNNANILVLGGRVFDSEDKMQEALEIVDIWLETNFEGGRHQERLDMITKIENNNFK
ncbi:MAG: ribose 5-phosphate isomerase B [Pseudomonadota bacterium]